MDLLWSTVRNLTTPCLRWDLVIKKYDVMNYIMNSWSNKKKKIVTTAEVALVKVSVFYGKVPLGVKST
jgi:hypothetical protein